MSQILCLACLNLMFYCNFTIMAVNRYVSFLSLATYVTCLASLPDSIIKLKQLTNFLQSLIQELEGERERRWKAEQAGRKLVDHIKALQDKDAEERNLQQAAIAASARLKKALDKERETKTALEISSQDLQVYNVFITVTAHLGFS